MVPFNPTAMNRMPVHFTSRRSWVVPETRGVHVIPSGDVRMVPPFPTTTHHVPDQATLNRVLAVPAVRDVELTASGEVTMVPFSPTATKSVPDSAIQFRASLVPEIRDVNVKPAHSRHQRPPRPRAPSPRPRPQAITLPAPYTAAPLDPAGTAPCRRRGGERARPPAEIPLPELDRGLRPAGPCDEAGGGQGRRASLAARTSGATSPATIISSPRRARPPAWTFARSAFPG